MLNYLLDYLTQIMPYPHNFQKPQKLYHSFLESFVFLFAIDCDEFFIKLYSSSACFFLLVVRLFEGSLVDLCET